MKTKPAPHPFRLLSIPDGEEATWYVRDNRTNRTTKGTTLRLAKSALRAAIKAGELPQEETAAA